MKTKSSLSAVAFFDRRVEIFLYICYPVDITVIINKPNEFDNMRRNVCTRAVGLLFIMTFLFGGNACGPSDDYVDEHEVRLMIREELRNFLTGDQILQLISNAIAEEINENRLRQLIIDELRNSITPEQIQQIIDEMAGGLLSEDEIRQIIKEETEKVSTGWEVIDVAVKKEDWQWNPETEQYGVIFDLPELTEFIYENGVQLGYVFIGQQGVDEVQKMLPYSFTYKELWDGETITYTETISCDFQLGNPSTVAFFIQVSDRVRADEYLTNYNFRIVLIW